MRLCRRCRHVKDEDDFYPHRHVCKECVNIGQRKERRYDDVNIVNELLKKWGRA